MKVGRYNQGMATQHLVYLALGTNLGERRQNLATAVARLRHFLTITALSSIYETAPWGVTDQPDFLNMCLAATTDLTPHDLLRRCQQIEAEMGRQKTIRYGPRLIDIDLLFYDDLLLDDETLTLPHPRLHERDFVLVPLADIAPELRHPRIGKTVAEMVQGLGETAVTPLGPLFSPDP